VKPGGLLYQIHAVALLKAELEPPGCIYSWMADLSDPTLEETLLEQLSLGM
jgi:hypothetical protein